MLYIIRSALISSILVLAACATPPPAISDIDGDHVKIQGLGRFANLSGDYILTEFDAKAAEACAIYGKTPSDALSVRQLGNYDIEVLYACR